MVINPDKLQGPFPTLKSFYLSCICQLPIQYFAELLQTVIIIIPKVFIAFYKVFQNAFIFITLFDPSCSPMNYGIYHYPSSQKKKQKLKKVKRLSQGNSTKWKSLNINYQGSFRTGFKCRLLLTGSMVLSKSLVILSFTVNV